MAKIYRAGAEQLNASCVGMKQLILIEGVRYSIFKFKWHRICWLLFLLFSFSCVIFKESKRSSKAYFGRNEANTKVIIPADLEIPKDFDNYAQLNSDNNASIKQLIKPGDFVVVDITESNSQVLKGTPLYHSTILDFSRRQYHNST